MDGGGREITRIVERGFVGENSDVRSKEEDETTAQHYSVPLGFSLSLSLSLSTNLFPRKAFDQKYSISCLISYILNHKSANKSKFNMWKMR